MSHKKDRLNVLGILLIGLMMVVPSLGQVVADQSAKKKLRPTVLLTSNGVPQVNIRTPSKSGVSVNHFSQFDVLSNGVILNNSRLNVFTQLGGIISANPWLKKGGARVIVGQVNSNNPSLLNGLIEVAGQRADVIIANPSGINIAGSGFINAAGVTLTTGTPLITKGVLDGFSVNQGLITISGSGLNVTGTEYTDLLTRALILNGTIQANELRVVTGANEFSADRTFASGTASGTAPLLAIDSSQLGGMYANSIVLIGTENGVGFNNAGQIQTTSGNITIDVDGNLTNAGTIGSGNSLDIASAGTNNSSGRLFAEIVNVNTGGNTFINDGGEITGFNTVTINSGELSNDAGAILSVGDLSINTNGQSLINTNSGGPFAGILGGGTVTLQTGEINNFSGNIASTNVNINTFGNRINNDLGNISGDFLTLDSGEISNNFGTILAVQDLSINTNGASLINVNSGFDRGIFSGGILNLQTGFLDNFFGNINGVTVNINTAGNIFNNDGGFVAGDDITINSGELSNNFATILSAGNIVINTNGGRLINVNGFDDKGIFGVNVDLQTGELINGTGNIISSENLNINTNGSIFRNDGGFVLGGNVDINSGELDNNTGSINSGESLTIDTNGEKLLNFNANSISDHSNGIIAGTTLILRTGVLDNSFGRIVSDGVASIDTFLSRLDGTSESNELNNSFGLIKSSGLTINSAKLTNHLGQISSLDFLNINTNGFDLINNGTGEGLGIIGIRDMQLRTGLLDNSGGRLVALNIDIDTDGNTVNNDAGFITALANATVNSGEFTNRNEGAVQAYGDLTINTNGRSLINTDSGEIRGIISNNALTIQTGQIENTNGRIIADVLNIETGTAEIRNGFGLIRGNNTVTIAGGALENDAGTILSKNDLNINTQGRVIVNAGLIQSEDGDLTIDTNGNDFLVFNTGKLGPLVIDGTVVQASRGITSGGNLTLTTGRFENVSSSIASQGNLLINTNQQELRNYHSGNVDLIGGILKGDGIVSNGTLTLQTGRIDNNTGTIESVGDLTIDTNGRELFNFNSGIITNPDGTLGTGGKGIGSQGLIFLNTGILNNSFGTIRGDRSITINTNGRSLLNLNSSNNGGQGIVAREHIGIFNAALDNTNGLLMSQTFSLNGTSVPGSVGTVIDPYFDGKLTLTGVSHLVTRPSNPFRDPFDQQNWVLNGISNSVSDFLAFDSLADSTFRASHPDFPLGERFVAGGTAVLISADLLTGGLGAGKAVRFGGQRILTKAPVIERFGGRIVSVDAFSGVKQSVKNRINPKNYEVVFDDTVLGSNGGGLRINYKGSGKWFDDAPEQLKLDIGDADELSSDLGVLFDTAKTTESRSNLVAAWRKLDALGADNALRKNPDAINYLANGRSNKILLEVEELLGGHSVARHGSTIRLTELEQRILGTHPTLPQSRSALKFDSDAIHRAAVNKAFREHLAEIEAHFASGGGYREWDSLFSGRIGEGYHNIGTRNNPISNYVTTDRIKIAFEPDPNSPSGYRLVSAFPWYVP